MHADLSGLLAEAHREDLLREAHQHRLVRQAHATRPLQGMTQWPDALGWAGAKVRLLPKPAPAASVACAPQPVCCPA